jgi:hypothetical protein
MVCAVVSATAWSARPVDSPKPETGRVQLTQRRRAAPSRALKVLFASKTSPGPAPRWPCTAARLRPQRPRRAAVLLGRQPLPLTRHTRQWRSTSGKWVSYLRVSTGRHCVSTSSPPTCRTLASCRRCAQADQHRYHGCTDRPPGAALSRAATVPAPSFPGNDARSAAAIRQRADARGGTHPNKALQATPATSLRAIVAGLNTQGIPTERGRGVRSVGYPHLQHLHRNNFAPQCSAKGGADVRKSVGSQFHPRVLFFPNFLPSDFWFVFRGFFWNFLVL